IFVAKLAQNQEQRPTNGDVPFVLQPVDNILGLSPQGKSMKQITANPEILAVFEEWPNAFQPSHPRQRHGRVRLALGQLLLVVILGIRGRYFTQFASEQTEPAFAVTLDLRIQQGKLLFIGIQQQIGQYRKLVSSVVSKVDRCQGTLKGPLRFPIAKNYAQGSQ